MVSWKLVSEKPPHERGCVAEQEGLSFLPTQSELPFFWRFCWPWRMLEFEVYSPHVVYFHSKGITMRTRAPISGHVCAVRIGPGDVCFWGRTDEGDAVPVEWRTGLLSRRQLKQNFHWVQRI